MKTLKVLPYPIAAEVRIVDDQRSNHTYLIGKYRPSQSGDQMNYLLFNPVKNQKNGFGTYAGWYKHEELDFVREPTIHAWNSLNWFSLNYPVNANTTNVPRQDQILDLSKLLPSDVVKGADLRREDKNDV